jgi:RNase P/RNase MRP subunit p29
MITLLLNIDGVVQGEVKKLLKLSKKKKRSSVKKKKRCLEFLVGAVGLNKELNQAAYQLDLDFQNKKGNIISAEYLNIGNQQFGLIGF